MARASVDASPESIFGSSHMRKSAKRLLNNYSNPWDPIAETVQNSVDALTTEYRSRLADRLSVPLDTDDEDEMDLSTAIESATDAVVDIDARSFPEISESEDFDEFDREGLDDDAEWGDTEYRDWIISEYFSSVANSLDVDEDAVVTAHEEVLDNYGGRIVFTREVDSRGIIVEDNGIGMSPDELNEALKRYGTLKDQEGRRTSQIGELGNGLTYVLANCDDFSIETCDGNTITEVQIEGMLSWVKGDLSIGDVEWNSEVIEEDTDEDSYGCVESAAGGGFTVESPV